MINTSSILNGKTKSKIKNYVLRFELGRILRDKSIRKNISNITKAKEVVEEKFPDSSDSKKQAIVSDMVKEAKGHDVQFYEYIMYDFYHKDVKERRQYIPTIERIRLIEKLNPMKNIYIFEDKYETYKKYKKFYHRDLDEFFNMRDYNRFNFFTKKHGRFIVKPFNGGCGVGIKIIDSNSYDIKELYKELLNDYRSGFVVEELIHQDREIAKFHPQSVNTVRITTIVFKDHIEIIHPYFRTGVGDNVVDNGGQGGIINAIDVDTGRIIGSADEKGNYYTKHPDTEIQLLGYTIPKWEEAKALAYELASVIPDNKYCGWDLALADNGWVLQEANDRGEFFGFQLPIKKGFRKEFNEILNRLDLS